MGVQEEVSFSRQTTLVSIQWSHVINGQAFIVLSVQILSIILTIQRDGIQWGLIVQS